MIKRDGYTEQEISILEHCASLWELGQINSGGDVIEGKETEFGFSDLAECIETMYSVTSDTSADIITKFRDMSDNDKVDAENQEKQNLVADAQLYLRQTDWYVIREADSGEAMPSDVRTKRAEARTTISNNRQ